MASEVISGEIPSNLTTFTPSFPDRYDNSRSMKRCVTFIASLILITLSIIGFIGNLISAFLFTRRSMRSSINILLASLSSIDFLVLLVSIPLFAVPGLNAYGHFGQLAGLQMANIFVFYPLALTAQSCSIWSFVMITVERYFAVCHPFKVEQFLTPKLVKLAQLIMIGLCIVYNLSRFWEYSVVYDARGNAIGYERYLRANDAYFLGYHTILYLLVHFWIPFSMIAVLNGRIAGAIDSATCIRTRLLITTIGNENKHQQRTTRMVAIVTAIFVACNFLPFCINIWEAASPSSFNFEYNYGIDSSAAYFISEISNVLVVLNSSINFPIYLVYCGKYRKLFRQYCKYPLGMFKGSTRSSLETIEVPSNAIGAAQIFISANRSRYTSSF